MPSQQELVEVAVDAARKAGKIQMEKFGKLLNVDAKTADDIKLEADRLCEQAIIETIKTRFPSHAIMAEESGRAEGAEYIWYIDPLDGTVNFYYGIPYFCTTMACCRQPASGPITPANMGEGVAAVTYAPPTDELFIGVADSGVTLNGRPVRVREETSMSEAYILSAFGATPEKIRFSNDVLFALAPKVRKIRNLGALAYDLACVAAGRASGLVQYGLRIWDVAAGRIMVEAAGGQYHARQMASGSWVVAAGGKTVQEGILEALDTYN